MGQTCFTCPADAQAGNAGGAGPVIYVVRNNQGEIVSPGRVGACEELYSYSYVVEPRELRERIVGTARKLVKRYADENPKSEGPRAEGNPI